MHVIYMPWDTIQLVLSKRRIKLLQLKIYVQLYKRKIVSRKYFEYARKVENSVQYGGILAMCLQSLSKKVVVWLCFVMTTEFRPFCSRLLSTFTAWIVSKRGFYPEKILSNRCIEVAEVGGWRWVHFLISSQFLKIELRVVFCIHLMS